MREREAESLDAKTKRRAKVLAFERRPEEEKAEWRRSRRMSSLAAPRESILIQGLPPQSGRLGEVQAQAIMEEEEEEEDMPLQEILEQDLSDNEEYAYDDPDGVDSHSDDHTDKPRYRLSSETLVDDNTGKGGAPPYKEASPSLPIMEDQSKAFSQVLDSYFRTTSFSATVRFVSSSASSSSSSSSLLSGPSYPRVWITPDAIRSPAIFNIDLLGISTHADYPSELKLQPFEYQVEALREDLLDKLEGLARGFPEAEVTLASASGHLHRSKVRLMGPRGAVEIVRGSSM
jgi:hypothetical protein